MKALILAGGPGTRLRTEVKKQPKPMAEVAGRPFLEWQLDLLKEYDITDVVLSVGYKDGIIKNHFGDGQPFGVDIEYVEEDEPLGTGGAVKQAQSLLEGEREFLVINGDTYLDVDLTELVAVRRRNDAVGALALSRVDEEKKGGFVERDDDNRIVDFVEEKRAGGMVNGGFRVFTPTFFEYMPRKQQFGLSEPIQELARSGELYGHVTDGYFKDIGTPERYHEINSELPDVL